MSRDLSLNVSLFFKNKSYLERLTLLNLQSLEHRRLNHDLILCFNIIHNHIAICQNDFFQLSGNTNTRGHPFKLTVPLTHTNLRRYFFSSRVIPIWNSLPANIVNASSSSFFKKLVSGHDLSLFLHYCDCWFHRSVCFLFSFLNLFLFSCIVFVFLFMSTLN